MACYHPRKAYQVSPGSKPVFKYPGPGSRHLKLPCGQCIGCRLRRSQEWAQRCVHEASRYKRNCFLTLTYAEPPYAGSLVKRHVQLFMKRLRRSVPQKVRFFAVGEYGEELQRPHYHLLLFNYWPKDAEFLKVHGENDYFIAPSLEKLWPRGFHMFGNITFESAAYCARYCTKKITGPAAESHYERLVPETGEIVQIQPEFAVMSRRPGIGRGWYQEYKDDVFPRDEVIQKLGVSMKPPRYYDKLFEMENVSGFQKVRELREQAAHESKDNHPRRLEARETVAKAKLNLKRRLL